MSGGGCGGGSCGISKVREAERERARRSVIEAYAERGTAASRGTHAKRKTRTPPSLASLGATFEDALPVRTFVADADAEDIARWLYLLVGLHRPSLFELREGRADRMPARREETYVRLGVSAIGGYATLQEIVMDREIDGDFAVVRETPRLGVVDTRLRKVVTCAQGVTRDAGLVLLDVAFLVEPAPAPLDAVPALRARLGSGPTMWSSLFDPAPPTTTREVIVPLPRGSD